MPKQIINGPNFPFTIRGFTEDDRAFIMDSWLGSLYENLPFSQLKKQVFTKNFRPLLNSYLANFVTIVACSPEYDDQVYGYLTYDKDLMVYMYVKHRNRQNTVATELLNHAFGSPEKVKYMYHTKAMKKLKPVWKMEYNPFRS